MKKVIGIVLASTVSMAAFAQSGTNSPYSQFGLGVLSEQSSGFNRGMNGLGLGFHEGNQVNYLICDQMPSLRLRSNTMKMIAQFV